MSELNKLEELKSHVDEILKVSDEKLPAISKVLGKSLESDHQVCHETVTKELNRLEELLQGDITYQSLQHAALIAGKLENIYNILYESESKVVANIVFSASQAKGFHADYQISLLVVDTDRGREVDFKIEPKVDDSVFSKKTVVEELFSIAKDSGLIKNIDRKIFDSVRSDESLSSSFILEEDRGSGVDRDYSEADAKKGISAADFAVAYFVFSSLYKQPLFKPSSAHVLTSDGSVNIKFDAFSLRRDDKTGSTFARSK